MLARDGPETMVNGPHNMHPTVEPNLSPMGTGTTKAVKSSKGKTKTLSKLTPKPKSKRGARPPRVTGYSWRKDGAGWQLRKSVYESDGTGTTKRRRPYVAHLSKSAFQEMKRRHKGASLEKAIAQWIEDHDR
jgi:hypothetical protein